MSGKPSKRSTSQNKTNNNNINTNTKKAATTTIQRSGAPRPGQSYLGGIFEDSNFRFSSTYTAVDNNNNNKLTSSSSARGLPSGTTNNNNIGTGSSTAYNYQQNYQRSVDESQKTPEEIAAAINKEERRRADEKAAMDLLLLSRSRKPNTVPLFLNSNTTASNNNNDTINNNNNNNTTVAVSVNQYRPDTHAIPPPSLGSAVGADRQDLLPLSRQERQELQYREQKRNQVLFQWWAQRQAVRLGEEAKAALETELRESLESGLMELVTREEGFWGEQFGASSIHNSNNHNSMNSNNNLAAFVNPKNKSAFGTNANNNHNSNATVNNAANHLTTPSMGLSVPIKSMESLFQGIRVLLHQKSIVLLMTHKDHLLFDKETTNNTNNNNNENNDDGRLVMEGDESFEFAQDAAKRLGDAQSASLVDFFIATEQELLREVLQDVQQQQSTSVSSTALLPSVVSLPPERILPPLLQLETAASVALLWRVLEQLKGVAPGVTFATQLLHHYILPHVYEGYTGYASVLPKLGTLREQIGLLSTLPLRGQAIVSADESLAQAREDVRYCEAVLKQWALRSWRRDVLQTKAKERQSERIGLMLRRLKQRHVVQSIFAAWRSVAREAGQERYQANIKEQYQQFIQGSDITAKMNDVPKTGTSYNDGMHFNRTKFLSTKLIESSSHTKGGNNHRYGFDGSKTNVKDVAKNVNNNNDAVAVVGDDGEVHMSELCAVLPLDSASPKRRTITVTNSNNLNPATATATSSDGSNSNPNALDGGNGAVVSVSEKVDTFAEMLDKLREMESVCSHLREEIAIQSNMLAKTEREKNGLYERNRALEADLLRTTEEKLHYCNLVQERQLQLDDKDRRITQLKSRIRAHRNRPWQRTVMRLVGAVCHCSTEVSERKDNKRIHQDIRGNAPARGKTKTAAGTGVKAARAAARESNDNVDSNGDEDEDEEEDLRFLQDEAETQRILEKEEERLYGDLAPIVLHSVYPLPDPLLVLQDWVNNCVDDLQSLDDLKGGALSVRVSSFSEEFRSGVLLSRLLFYLALPRYLQRHARPDDVGQLYKQSAVAAGDAGGGQGVELELEENFNVRRQQLLDKQRVQLDSPFPTFSECFGDLLQMQPLIRMMLLLNFASQLMEQTATPPSELLKAQYGNAYKAVNEATGLTLPPPSAPVSLAEMIDPHALVEGERSTIVTLIALLYIRFAHPFNHKPRQSTELERAMILHLLSKGEYKFNAEGRPMSIQDEMLLALQDEDKSPWQLFKERCLPMFASSSAHPFLLRGNFWPSDAFDSPQLAEVLGSLGLALDRSLELHRWHVLTTCLVPVPTFSGLSRGVFTGPRASAMALQTGLIKADLWTLPLSSKLLRERFARRCANVMDAVERGKIDKEYVLSFPFLEEDVLIQALLDSPEQQLTPQRYGEGSNNNNSNSNNSDSNTSTKLKDRSIVSRELYSILRVIRDLGEDILQLFLRFSFLSAEKALPVLDLGGWRLLCVEMGVTSFGTMSSGDSDSNEEDSSASSDGNNNSSTNNNNSKNKAPCHVLLEMEEITSIFQESILAFRDSESISHFNESGTDNFEKTIDSSRSRSHESTVSLPIFNTQMLFPAFMIALLGLADSLYPDVKRIRPLTSEQPTTTTTTTAAASNVDESQEKKESEEAQAAATHDDNKPAENTDSRSSTTKCVLWIGDALEAILSGYLKKHTKEMQQDPIAIVNKLIRGTDVQETLVLHTPLLLMAFHAYSRDLYGSASMERDDLLRVLRDAMLTSTEISQYLISELFVNFSIVRKLSEEQIAANRREADGRPRDGRRTNRSVSILAPAGAGETGGVPTSPTLPSSPATDVSRRNDVRVLLFDGFIQVLCVLCNFKQPNPLVPFGKRFHTFLRRAVLRPLSNKVNGLAPLLNATKNALKDETTGAGNNNSTNE